MRRRGGVLGMMMRAFRTTGVGIGQIRCFDERGRERETIWMGTIGEEG